MALLTISDFAAKWRQPEFRAGVFNGGLILLVPVILSVYLDYTDTAVHPHPRTLLSSAVFVLPALLFFAPIAMLVLATTALFAMHLRCVLPEP